MYATRVRRSCRGRRRPAIVATDRRRAGLLDEERVKQIERVVNRDHVAMRPTTVGVATKRGIPIGRDKMLQIPRGVVSRILIPFGSTRRTRSPGHPPTARFASRTTGPISCSRRTIPSPSASARSLLKERRSLS